MAQVREEFALRPVGAVCLFDATREVFELCGALGDAALELKRERPALLFRLAEIGLCAIERPSDDSRDL